MLVPLNYPAKQPSKAAAAATHTVYDEVEFSTGSLGVATEY